MTQSFFHLTTNIQSTSFPPLYDIMSSAPTPYAFRRRTVGRAASPPTWACYEQIPNDYSDSGSDSCSEDDESYDQDNSSDSEDHNQESQPSVPDNGHAAADVDSMDMDMDPAEAEAHHDPDSITPEPTITSSDKGKQRAIDPEPESPPSRRRHRRKNRHSYPLRPILTIHRSQGFVWNQVSRRERVDMHRSHHLSRTCLFLPTSKTVVRPTCYFFPGLG